MPASPRGLDIWLVVLLCAVSCQFLKLLLYSAAQRRLHLAILGQSAGLPSLHAAVGASLLTMMVIRAGWQAEETAVAMVLAVITVFDAIRVRGATQAQRRLVHDLILLTPEAGPLRRQVVGYLDILAHAPVHVVAGIIWGALFAVALGTA